MDRRIRSPRLLGAALLVLVTALAACSDETSPTGPVPGLPPTVLGVQPGVVDAGGSATIRGLNFAGQPSANEVTFGDLTASVGSASETSLSISLPAPTELPCRPTRRVPLRVSVAGRADTIRHRFSVAPGIGLEPGQFRAFTTPNSGYDCREFPAASDEFLVSVYNSARSGNTRIGFELIGKPGAGVKQDSVAASVTGGQGAGLSAGRGVEAGAVLDALQLPPALRQSLRADRAHRRVLEANRRLVERMRRGGGAGLPRDRPSTSAPDVPNPSLDQPPEVGDHVQIRVPDLNAGSICKNFVEVTGRVAHVTEHAVLLSDTANPIDGEFDDRLREMGNEFERRMWPVIRDNYGDPLRLDGQLNDDGHFYMMFTPEVNEFGNALAFVFAGDFFPRSNPDGFECASSDEAEVFYSRAPTVVAPNGYENINQTAQWQRILRSTLVHEVKHLTAYAERLARNVPFETTWLEESTAHMAEELYARRVFGFSQGSGTGYDGTLECAVRPTGGAGCEPGSPSVMVGEFVWLARYMRSPTQESPIYTPLANPVFRGAGWWLLRWAADHAPTSESQFLKAMTTSPETGIANLEARTGRDWAGILADWTLSLAVDDREGADRLQRAELGVPSWDLRDVYLGLHQDFGERIDLFSSPYPLNLRTESYGEFKHTVGGLRGGSSAIFRLVGGPGSTQLLELTGGAAGPLPPFLRMSVVRMP